MRLSLPHLPKSPNKLLLQPQPSLQTVGWSLLQQATSMPHLEWTFPVTRQINSNASNVMVSIVSIASQPFHQFTGLGISTMWILRLLISTSNMCIRKTVKIVTKTSNDKPTT